MDYQAVLANEESINQYEQMIKSLHKISCLRRLTSSMITVLLTNPCPILLVCCTISIASSGEPMIEELADHVQSRAFLLISVLLHWHHGISSSLSSFPPNPKRNLSIPLPLTTVSHFRFLVSDLSPSPDIA